MNIEALLEAEKRGILPDQMKGVLDEARRRGLVDGEKTAKPAMPANLKPDVSQLDAALLGAGQGMFLGASDEASGLVQGVRAAASDFGGGGSVFDDDRSFTGRAKARFNKGYEQGRDGVRSALEQARDDYPMTTLAGEVTGSMALPIGAVGAAKNAPQGADAARRALTLGTNVAKAGGSGAGMAALYGFNQGEGGLQPRLDDAFQDAQTGAMIGAAIPFAGAGVQKAANALSRRGARRAAVKSAQTGAGQKAAAQDLYNQVDQSGVEITPEAFARLRSSMGSAMDDVGLDRLPGPGSLTPKAKRVNDIAQNMADKLDGQADASLSFKSLDQLRRHAGNAAADAAPFTGKATTDAAAGSAAIGQIDDFVEGLASDDVVSGDLDALQDLLPKAREAWQRMSKTRMVEDAIENSDNYLSGRASGIRNQFKRIYSNPKAMRGFSEEEKKLIKRVASGSLPEQLLYLAGSGMGNLATMGLGLSGGPVTTAMALAASGGLRKGAEMNANRNAQIARALIASGKADDVAQISASPEVRRITQALLQRTVPVLPQ